MSISPTPGTLPVGRTDMNFSSVGGGIAGQPVITTMYDLAPWYQIRSVFSRHSIAPSFRMLLRAFGGGFTRGVSADRTSHYEEDWRESLLHVGSIVTAAGGAGNSMVIALDASSMYSPGITSGGATRKASYPQKGQRILFPDGQVAYIESKNVTTDPHRLTIKPALSTVDLDTVVTAGEKYFIFDNAWGEGTGLPTGVLQRLYKYTNTFQIIKHAFGASGSALTTEFLPVWEREGENIAMILKPKTIQDFERSVSNALLFGQQMNNISDTTGSQLGYDVAITGTEGLLAFSNSNGYIDTYTPGSYAISDFYSVTRAMEQERGGGKYLVGWQGYDIYTEMEQVFQNYYQYSLLPKMVDGLVARSGPQTMTDGWQPSNEGDFVAWLGFKYAHLGGYTLMMGQMHEFNHPLGAGATGYDYMGYSIWQPVGTTLDMKTNQPVANLGYEWRELDGYKREAIFATIAGAGVAGAGGYVPATLVSNEFDYMNCGVISEIAFHAACGNRLYTQKPL